MNRIINIRGTSGAGKSHLARRVMANYPVRKPVHVAGRKQPLYYEYEAPDHNVPLFVVGHYECACGGTDTMKRLSAIGTRFSPIKSVPPTLV